MNDNIKVKFLILRFTSIESILLSTPLIRCLKKQVEGAEIHYVVRKAYALLLEGNPYLHKVHILEDSYGNLVKRLKEERFDYIIDLQRDLMSAMIKTRLGRISFDVQKIDLRKWIMVNFKRDLLGDRQWAERCLDAVSLFDVVNDNKGLDFFLPDHEHVDLKRFPQEFRNGYIAFVIEARYQTRKLPADMIARICSMISYPVILIGGPEEAPQGEVICNESGTLVWNGCGKYTFRQSASLINQARMVITHDTGLMQVAAAFRQRIISIWGNTLPAFGLAPYMPHKHSRMFEVKELRCRPCSVKGYSTCPKRHFQCMRNIDLTELVLYVQGILEREQTD